MLALEGEVTHPLTRKSLKYEGRQAKWGEQGGNGAIEIEHPGRLMSPENAQAGFWLSLKYLVERKVS